MERKTINSERQCNDGDSRVRDPPAPMAVNPFDVVVVSSNNDTNDPNDVASVSSRSTAGIQSMPSIEVDHESQHPSSQQIYISQLHHHSQTQSVLQQQTPPALPPQAVASHQSERSSNLIPPNLHVNVHHNPSSSPIHSAGNTPTQIPPVISAAGSSGTMEAPGSLTSPDSGIDGSDGILLGVQALEQQQANWEASQHTQTYSGRPPQPFGSSQRIRVVNESVPPMDIHIDSTDFLVKSNIHGYDEVEVLPVGPHNVKPLVVYGYLQKQARKGSWQTRFFETDGENLMYYKNSKRSKMLASLDLAKVGAIQEDEGDISGRTFTIQVAGRPYFLRAEDRSTCKDWVINLNRVREARVQLGRMKLVEVDSESRGPDTNSFRKESGDEYVSRVVVKANRSRTHGMRDESDLLELFVDPANEENRPSYPPPRQTQIVRSMSQPSSFMDANLTEVLARWDKKRTRIALMRTKLIRWARQVKIVKCVGDERDVVTQQSGRERSSMHQGHGGEGQSWYPSRNLNDGTDTVQDSDAGACSQMDQNSVAKTSSDESKPLGHSAWIARETQINSQRGESLAGYRMDRGNTDQSASASVDAYDEVNDDARSLS